MFISGVSCPIVDVSTPDAMCKPGLCPQPPDFQLEIWDLKLGIARFSWCGVCVVSHCVTQNDTQNLI